MALRKTDRREQRLRDKALSLQATEYERRLDELNHAHAEAKEKESEYVTREKYEDYVRQADIARETAFNRLDDRIRTMEKNLGERIISLDLSRADNRGRTGGLTSGWKLLLGGLGLILILLQILNYTKPPDSAVSVQKVEADSKYTQAQLETISKALAEMKGTIQAKSK